MGATRWHDTQSRVGSSALSDDRPTRGQQADELVDVSSMASDPATCGEEERAFSDSHPCLHGTATEVLDTVVSGPSSHTASVLTSTPAARIRCGDGTPDGAPAGHGLVGVQARINVRRYSSMQIRSWRTDHEGLILGTF